MKFLPKSFYRISSFLYGTRYPVRQSLLSLYAGDEQSNLSTQLQPISYRHAQTSPYKTSLPFLARCATSSYLAGTKIEPELGTSNGVLRTCKNAVGLSMLSSNVDLLYDNCWTDLFTIQITLVNCDMKNIAKLFYAMSWDTRISLLRSFCLKKILKAGYLIQWNLYYQSWTTASGFLSTSCLFKQTFCNFVRQIWI